MRSPGLKAGAIHEFNIVTVTQFLTKSRGKIISTQNACSLIVPLYNDEIGKSDMSSIQYICGQCQGTNFPEGMFLYHCPLCQMHIHPGCWDAHKQHHQTQGEPMADQLEPRRGKISAYGIIQWDN